MARTIPGFLGIVPANDTVQVSANGRVLMDVTALIAIHGDLAAAVAYYRSFARLDGGNITNITGREVVLVLLGNVHVFFHVCRSRANLDPGRIVEACPLVPSSLHQLV